MVVFCLGADRIEIYPMPAGTTPGEALRVVKRMLSHLDARELTIVVERPPDMAEVWTTQRPAVALYRLAVALSEGLAAELRRARVEAPSDAEQVASS